MVGSFIIIIFMTIKAVVAKLASDKACLSMMSCKTRILSRFQSLSVISAGKG